MRAITLAATVLLATGCADAGHTALKPDGPPDAAVDAMPSPPDAPALVVEAASAEASDDGPVVPLATEDAAPDAAGEEASIEASADAGPSTCLLFSGATYVGCIEAATGVWCVPPCTIGGACEVTVMRGNAAPIIAFSGLCVPPG